MPAGLSPLAHLIAHPRDVADRARPVYGAVVHTTGSGLPRKAARLGIPPEELAVTVYSRNPYFPHYFIAYDGTTYQIANERERALHAGISPAERALYLSGAWRRKLPPRALQLWQQQWLKLTRWIELNKYSNPLLLFPGTVVNDVYLGIELIPLLAPQYPGGGLFTDAQYVALAGLLNDIWDRNALSSNGFVLPGPRLLGHEDVNPLARSNSGGGWDPGALRDEPVFSWSRLSDALMRG